MSSIEGQRIQWSSKWLEINLFLIGTPWYLDYLNSMNDALDFCELLGLLAILQLPGLMQNSELWSRPELMRAHL